MLPFAANLRRVMANQGLTLADVVARTGVDERTVKALHAGRQSPHAKTLHRIAAGLEIPPDELFQDPALLTWRATAFDRATNPVVDDFIGAHQALFAGWSEQEFAELYSRFGHGGPLTEDGTRQTVEAMNRRREVLARVAVLLETEQADVVECLVQVLYEKVTVRE